MQTRKPYTELALFFAAVSLFAFSQSIVEATFNNFVSETFAISDLQRGILEVPREIPGFLVAFYAVIFFFMSSRRLAAFAAFLAGVGILLVGHLSSGYALMLMWLFIFSSGQHIFLPLYQSIGMEFSDGANAGKKLGQLSGVMNLAAIVGSIVVFLGFRYLGLTFKPSFTLASAGFLAAAALLLAMKPDRPAPAKAHLQLKKKYSLYYWLSILFGTRKQIFLTFAPWVLVTVFKQKTATVATLLAIGGVIGIVFKPLLGRAIDRLGERPILMAEAGILVFVCVGYGFSRQLFPETAALYVAFGCYVLDQLLMSVSMARATYVKKIALDPAEVSQTLTLGTTIDHVFSISIALVSGMLWVKLGYQYVFMLAALIACVNLVSASYVKTAGK